MSTHYRGTAAETRALDALIKLLRATESISRRSRTLFQEAGLTESQFGVLEALLHLGPLTPGELGRRILKSAGNLTLVIDNLIKRGLVDRQPAEEDRRRRPVSLTLAGRELIASLFPRHVRRIVGFFAALTAKEQTELSRLCRKLGLDGCPDPGSGEGGNP